MAAELAKELIGKSLECTRSDGSYDPQWGDSHFFLSRSGKLTWTSSELADPTNGTTAQLRGGALLASGPDSFTVQILNLEDVPTRLTFERARGAIRLSRTDRTPRGQPRPAERCLVKAGRGTMLKQQKAAVTVTACGQDPSDACERALRRFCGLQPSEKCRAGNQRRIDAASRR